MTETQSLPAPDHTVTLADGRTVAIDEHGTPDGPVVTLLHCCPGSRLLDPDPAATAAAGVRLLTIDRAGYGASSPVGSGVLPTFADRSDDVAAALVSLGVTETAVVGWSYGGLVALGLAARHPQLVRSVALAGTPAPDDEVPWVLDWQRPAMEAMRADPASARATLTPMLAAANDDPEVARSNAVVGAADEARYQADPAAFDRFLAGAFQQGPDGVACDIIAMHVNRWGFDPRSVGAPVQLWYGEADEVVSTAHAAYWQSQLADSAIHLVPGEGHLVTIPAWEDILASVSDNATVS